MNLKAPINNLRVVKNWVKTFVLENDYSERKRRMRHLPSNLLIAYIRISIIVAIIDGYLNKIFADARQIDTGSAEQVDSASSSVSSALTSSHVRHKRNVLQFGLVIECENNDNAMEFTDYGCYCGASGGGQPVDELDWCCYQHDHCWKDISDSEGSECTGLWHPYAATYDWGCSEKSGVHCYDEPNSCHRRTCDCDRQAAQCFAKAKYNPANYQLDQEKHCKSEFIGRPSTTTEELPDDSIADLWGNSATTVTSSVQVSLLTTVLLKLVVF